uniref:RanBP2-type domain-containing protein n=1 Tax=Oryza rufipogon TaxID=4529 RepID=A0A0E0Q700_ORYRU
MASSYVLSLLRRRRRRTIPTLPPLLPRLLSSSSFSYCPSSLSPAKPPSLSARLSFVFDQLDALDRSRFSDHSARDAALRRIQSWRRPAALPDVLPAEAEPRPAPEPGEPVKKEPEAVDVAGKEELERMSVADVLRREVELVHPWPEWIELMDRLAQQKYFDLGGTGGADEGCVAAAVPMDLAEVTQETGFDFSRDWTTVKNACMNFGRDRFDIVKSLPRKDLQVLVGHGCPSMDPKVVFSAKLIRKLVHLDEGDVCSSCNLRNLCSRGYILTRKEDEARTLDVMRILLFYGFDHVKETVENKPLLKLKSVKTVVRKLIHDIAKLSAVPIDPNLPPPIIRKPPPKVKQPPPPPKKRVGRDDVEMKKGDWLCPKCDFMNFAKNTICLQCDAKRPKRQLLPGEWECPRCNFLNYRRNMSCFHCEHNRPPDEYTNSQMEANLSVPRKRLERPAHKSEVCNAWNFDFDDNESDGADVAAFEFADSSKARNSLSVDNTSSRGGSKFSEDKEFGINETWREGTERRFSERERVGFDDFDDEEDDIDSYELDLSKGGQTDGMSRMSYSDFEDACDSADLNGRAKIRNSKHGEEEDIIGSPEDEEFDHPSQSSHLAASWRKPVSCNGSNNHRRESFGSESDDGIISDLDGDINEGLKCKGGHNKHYPRRAVVRHNELDDVPFSDMDCDIGGCFQSDRRNRFSTKFSDEFHARASNSNRKKMNERFKSSDMRDGHPPFDRTRRRGTTELHDGSRDLQSNARRNWVKSGGFDDNNRPLRRLNRR